MGAVDYKMEHVENISRRNNVKVTGIEESPNLIKEWDEFETIVKEKIRSYLTITEGLEIESAHQVKRLNE